MKLSLKNSFLARMQHIACTSSIKAHGRVPIVWRSCLVVLDVFIWMLLAYLLIRLISGYDFWPVKLMSQFLHWVLLPVFVIFPSMLLFRLWYRAAAASVGVVMFMVLYGELFIPANSNIAYAGQPCDPVVFMTYNVGFDLVEPSTLAQYLAASDADVIGLQEVTSKYDAVVRDQLMDVFPYQFWDGMDNDGLAILSRYPIVSAEYTDVHWQHLQPYILAKIDVKSQQLQVVVHRGHPPSFGSHPEWRNGRPIVRSGFITWRNGESLTEVITSDTPTVILVDLNITDQSPDYKYLTEAGFRDAFRLVGKGFGSTYPAARNIRRNLPDLPPLVRIDYIWSTTEFHPINAWVEAGVGSDHFPVLATFCIQR